MSKKNKKLAKRRLIVFGSLSIVAIIWFFSTLITYTMNIKNLKNEKTNLENQLLELKESADDLKNEIEKLKDPEYLARYARSEYSYSKSEGEYVIRINEDEDNVVQITKEKNSFSKYIIGGSGIILLLIIVYIIKK